MLLQDFYLEQLRSQISVKRGKGGRGGGGGGGGGGGRSLITTQRKLSPLNKHKSNESNHQIAIKKGKKKPKDTRRKPSQIN